MHGGLKPFCLLIRITGCVDPCFALLCILFLLPLQLLILVAFFLSCSVGIRDVFFQRSRLRSVSIRILVCFICTIDDIPFGFELVTQVFAVCRFPTFTHTPLLRYVGGTSLVGVVVLLFLLQRVSACVILGV